jgi:hypothetical protein
MAELATRLERVEPDLAAVKAEVRTIGRAAAATDSDVASLQEQRRADVRLLQAFRTTQLEQSATLVEHGQVLGMLVTVQQEQSEVLRQHTEALTRIERHLGIPPES